jgi:membrane-associated phospholipid phosphatase
VRGQVNSAAEQTQSRTKSAREVRFYVCSAVIAAAIYGVLWVGFRGHWPWLHWVDVDATAPLRGYAIAHPAWLQLWDVISTVFGPNGFRVLGLAVVVFAALRREARAALFVLACVGLSGSVSVAAKALADRPRPTAAMVYAESSSFPSGHALGAMAGVFALLTVTTAMLGRARPYAVVLGALVIVAVGFGRVALGVHYPSDVVAGWALGYLWFLLCLLIFRPPPLGSGRNTGNAR